MWRGKQKKGGRFPKRRGALREESPMWAKVPGDCVEAGRADTEMERGGARTALLPNVDAA